MNRKRVKLALSLTASALILLLWGFLEPERPTLLSQPEYIGEVDAYVSGVIIRQYDLNGMLTHSVKGDRVRHLPNHGSTLIDQPQLTLFRENKAPMSATARFGEIESDHETVWLREDAVVFNQLDQRFRLESPYLKVLTKQQLVETDADIILHQPIGATYATGLTADFSTNKLQLHHAVRGTYEPN